MEKCWFSYKVLNSLPVSYVFINFQVKNGAGCFCRVQTAAEKNRNAALQCAQIPTNWPSEQIYNLLKSQIWGSDPCLKKNRNNWSYNTSLTPFPFTTLKCFTNINLLQTPGELHYSSPALYFTGEKTMQKWNVFPKITYVLPCNHQFWCSCSYHYITLIR